MPDALYVVDGSGFVFRAYHALPRLSTRAGAPTGAAYGFAQMLIKLEQDHRPSHLAVVFDASSRSFRHDLYDGYKANRTAPPDDLVPQFELVRRVVDAFGVPQLALPSVEADDVIASMTKIARARGMRVVIVSSDKDLMQLVTDDVVLHDTMKDVTYGPAEVKAKFGVTPAQLGDVLALMGDSIDNVPGVPGVGPKTASTLVAEFGSLDGLFARLDEVKMRGAERIKELVRTHAEAVRLSRRLVTLAEDVAIPVELEALRRREPDFARVAALFRELEFERLTERLGPAAQGAAGALASGVPAGGGGGAGGGGAGGGGAGGGGAGGNGATGATALEGLAAQAGGGTAGATGAHAPSPATAAVVAARTPRVVLGDEPVRVIATDDALGALVGELGRAGELAVTVESGEGAPMRAPLVGIAFATDGGAPSYLPLGHRYLGVAPQLAAGTALERLAPILADRAVKKRVHRFKAAHLALGRSGVVLDGVVGDPELSSYLLDPAQRHDLCGIAERYGLAIADRVALCGSGKRASAYETIEVERAAAYAGRAAAATLALDRLLAAEVAAAGMSGLLEAMELPLSRVLSVVERHGVRLDTGALADVGREVDADLERLEKEVHVLAGYEVHIGSPKQLQELLFDKLALPPVRRTKTGFSTDADTLEELAPLHPVAAKILEHRVLAKLKSTYIDLLPALVDAHSGRLHTSFHQAVAATGRLSSSDPNLQNIPIRTDLGMKIRRAFIADAGNLLIAADYSQIELRIVAHLSKDPVLLDSFRRGEDVHTRTAAEVFGLAPAAVSAEQRRVAKAINFGIVYGQTDFGLSKVLGIDKGDARRYIEGYFARYASVAGLMESLIRDARREMGSRTLLGRFRRLPDLEAKNRTIRQAAERMARNAPIQGTAADILKLAMIRVEERLEAEAPAARMLLTVHDELVLEAPAAEAPRVAELVRETMSSAFPLDVPLQVDVGVGPTWADC